MTLLQCQMEGFIYLEQSNLSIVDVPLQKLFNQKLNQSNMACNNDPTDGDK